ncbi:MAG: hypothetical protein K2O40_01090, partial [Lachnospiraceae bacterium]|nr:hypothetical protein [Lachnospiraceae bacterium]
HGLGGSEAVEKLDKDLVEKREINDEYHYHTIIFSDKAPSDRGELLFGAGKGTKKSRASGDNIVL